MALDLELHKSRLNAYGIGTRDGQIDFVQTKVTNEFANSPSYISAFVNGSSIARDFHLFEDSFYRSDPNRKKLIAKPNETVSIGDYFYFNNEYWLAYALTDTTNPVYETIQIRKCNLLPFYYKIGETPYTTYGYYEKRFTTNENNEPINLPNDTVLVSIPLNTTSKKIKKNDYFYLFDEDGYERYQVEGIDKSKKLGSNGLIVLRGKESQSDITPEQFYNLEPVSPTEVGSVIVTPSTLSLNIGDTKQMVANVYDKSGILMPEETVTWVSSNTAIATVSATGLVTVKAIGNVEIIAKSVTDDEIVGKCLLEVLDDSGGWWG